ncbi:MAG: RES family NAD+ phosphorylase [Gammaproteobacteria bacterium]|nr:RES family NAD+ phosphorylase [Gammaproteobacteria bacterium]MYE53542.1 RES family NAD+ phosphorylase [Gammaproteobacteria bacterium]MYH15385.1 RES family NAD+ phosphorylase [Gammaproteobacteria bacterium]MYK84042.1 RES family NAD+ phosphorylase [Gammaproteobacteria bacterium]
MGGQRRRSPGGIRDQSLLDALEAVPMAPFEGTVWRSVRRGQDPLVCRRSGGRWDDGTMDVLYTSETREGALAERRFHLFQGQPFPPSRVRYEMFELMVSLGAVMRFAGLEALAQVGLRVAGYGQLSYLERERECPRSQEIAEACAFLGADGLRVPSARDATQGNLIVFCEQPTVVEKRVVRNHGPVDFSAA